MMSRSGGLKPKAVAGKPSVTRLTHSNWTGMRASGKPRAAVKKILRRKQNQQKNFKQSQLDETFADLRGHMRPLTRSRENPEKS